MSTQGELLINTPDGGLVPKPDLDSSITYYWKAKSNGSTRQIWQTDDDTVLMMHRGFLDQLRYAWKPLDCVKGGEPGGSVVGHVAAHRANGNFFVLDMQGAYDQVSHTLLGQELDRLGVHAEYFLDRYALHPRGQGVLTGMPASPSLFNIACRQLDEALLAYCEGEGITYTRYLDDCIFSRPLENPLPKAVRAEIREIFSKHSWELNNRKTKLMSHDRGPVILCGIQLDPGGGMRPSKRLTRKASAVIEAALAGEGSYNRAAGYYAALIGMSDPRFITKEVKKALDLFKLLQAMRGDEERSFLVEMCATAEEPAISVDSRRQLVEAIFAQEPPSKEADPPYTYDYYDWPDDLN